MQERTNPPPYPVKAPLSSASPRRDVRQAKTTFCRFWLVVSDLIAIAGGLVGAYYLRFNFFDSLMPDDFPFAPQKDLLLANYFVRILVGGIILVFLLVACDAYRKHTMLRYRRSFLPVAKALCFWIILYPGLSLILEIDHNLSRVYVVISFLCLLASLMLSRFITQRLLGLSGLTTALQERILFVDWTEKSARIARAALNDPWHPYDVVACAPAPNDRFTITPPLQIPTLGSYKEVNILCDKNVIDIVILSDGDHREEDVLAMATDCERNLVNFMIIPSGFQILMSGLELTTVSSVPLLGVTRLPLDNAVNSTAKRIIDIIGASFGLILSAPIILFFAILVYLESPGPIFYRQIRVGRKGRHFRIIKIRSMKLDAEKDSGARWATEGDERRLKVGAFMRRWNIDELPQFINVMQGALSLVGPRPERPELIQKFRDEIPFYNARHNIIPGMTGWAQVNGYRGDTDLGERIRYDIYYIEHWSVILDFQIMVMTFYRWKGAH